MPFNSFNFWLVFPIIFIIYWAIPSRLHKVRNLFLVVVSYLLYMNWKPAFAIVLLAVTAVTFLGGYQIEDLQESSKKRALCVCFSFLGLLPLLVFKYYNFLNETIISVLEKAGLHFALPGLNWAVPVGLSFFTFQAVGYLLDVYHDRCRAERNALDYMLFVSFFPQVTSGPISTAAELLPQIKTPRTFDYEQTKQGLKYLLWGMFMKLVIADIMGMIVDTVYTNYVHYNGTTCFIASVFFTIQIYCDFAGYSLMAIGIARALGFNLINNFERPYLAASVTEFWKRWHISLTRWLTTHVYIGLGGSRCSKLKQYLNIMITFLVSGLWHGANWTFVVWGGLHGLFQIVEKALVGDRLKKELKSGDNHLTFVRVIRMAVTFLLVNFAWIFFRMPNLSDAADFISRFVTEFGGPVQLIPIECIPALAVGLPLLFAKDIYDEYLQGKCRWARKPVVVWAFYLFLFCFMIAMGVHDNAQFLYVNF